MSARVGFLFVIVVCVTMAGCRNFRVTVAAKVPDMGTKIATKYRYACVDSEGAYLPDSNKRLQSAFPEVFASNGVPFQYKGTALGPVRKSFNWTFPLFCMSLGIVPQCATAEQDYTFVVKIPEIPEGDRMFKYVRRADCAVSELGPLAWLCYPSKAAHLGNGDEFDKCRLFSSRGKDPSKGDDTSSFLDDAEVYGITATLKQMEVDGIVNDAVVANANKDTGAKREQAELDSITPISRSYDSSTRRGVICVRFGAGQYEAARAWAKKNIEMLVRDKNIALTTGSLPPEGHYYSLGERLKDGNILEIEFRTE